MEFLFLLFAVWLAFASGMYIQSAERKFGVLIGVLSLVSTLIVVYHMLGISL
jgi:hypothetical protein